MGKRPEDLPLDDTPLPDHTKEASDDPRGTEWYQFVADIQDLLATGRYAWAQTTLDGIAETVERTQKVSDRQRQAVENIMANASSGRRGRRYW